MTKRNFELNNKRVRVLESVRQKPVPQKKSHVQRKVKVTLPKVSFLENDVPEE